MIDVRLERWITASINTYFNGNKGPYFVFFEGDQAKMSEWPAWVEVRINGPRYRTHSKDEHLAELEINLAITVKDGQTDSYLMQRMIGYFRLLCETEIPVKKLGDAPTENVGCFTLRADEPRPLDVIPWGQMQAESSTGPIQVQSTTIDAYLKMDF